MDKKDVGCIYNRILLRHFYEMLLFATAWLDLEGIRVSSLGACTGPHSLAYYPVSRRGGQWVLPFYRLNVLDTNQKVPDISQGFIYMHITTCINFMNFHNWIFPSNQENQGTPPPLITTKQPAAPAYSLCTRVQTLGGPTWCAMSSSPDCEYTRLTHCCQPHLHSVGWWVFGFLLIFKVGWIEDDRNSMALLILRVLLNGKG